MRRVLTASALAAVFAAGLVLAGTSIADTTTTTDTTAAAPTTTEVSQSPTPAPVTTTVERTTTQRVFIQAPQTTTESTTSSTSDTPTWVWVLLGILAVGLGVLVFMLASRGGHHDAGGGVSDEERRRIVDNAAGSWMTQGWAIDSQTADSAVLRRGDELLLVSVDKAGHVSTRPLAAPA